MLLHTYKHYPNCYKSTVQYILHCCLPICANFLMPTCTYCYMPTCKHVICLNVYTATDYLCKLHMPSCFLYCMPTCTHCYIPSYTKCSMPTCTRLYAYLCTQLHAYLYIFLSRPLQTQLENIGSVYPFYVYDGNRPLAPMLRQRRWSLMYDVYWLAWWWLMFNGIKIPEIHSRIRQWTMKQYKKIINWIIIE
jgi:hypothetical protein